VALIELEVAMSDATEEFFLELGRRGNEPLLRNATGTIRFDLHRGDGVERWVVAMKNGDVAVSRRQVHADCVVRMDRALFDQLVRGRANAMAAVLRGVLSPEGDLGLLVLFQRLFPAASRSAERTAKITKGAA